MFDCLSSSQYPVLTAYFREDPFRPHMKEPLIEILDGSLMAEWFGSSTIGYMSSARAP